MHFHLRSSSTFVLNLGAVFFKFVIELVIIKSRGSTGNFVSAKFRVLVFIIIQVYAVFILQTFIDRITTIEIFKELCFIFKLNLNYLHMFLYKVGKKMDCHNSDMLSEKYRSIKS